MSEEPENLDKLFSELAGSATMSPLDAQSHEMHEMFLSLMRVGFSEKQALFIISMAVISLDVGEGDDEEIIITSDHPSNRDGFMGTTDRHSSTASELDEEDLDDEEDKDSSL